MSNNPAQGAESIHNEQGLQNVPLYTGGSVEGHADSGAKIRNRVNPRLPQIHTFTVGGAVANGAYSFAVVDETGATVATISHTRSGSETTNDVAAALRAALAANTALKGKIKTTNPGTGAEVIFNGAHARKSYTFKELTAPSGATLTGVVTQSAGGVAIPFGRFMIEGADPRGRTSPTASHQQHRRSNARRHPPSSEQELQQRSGGRRS